MTNRFNLTTLCDNKDHLRRPPPIVRLGTGTDKVRSVAELHTATLINDTLLVLDTLKTLPSDSINKATTTSHSATKMRFLNI